MSLIFQLPKIFEEAKSEYEALRDREWSNGDFSCCQQFCFGSGNKGNLMAKGDNLQFMLYLLQEKKMAGKLQLIYVDPPFYSKANYDAVIKLKSDKVKDIPAIKLRAYNDSWQEGIEAYLKMLCLRFFCMKELLSEEGCLWVHLDWHAAHYVKLLLDEVFGEKNFINEIIWNYKSGGTGKRSFSKKHDTLLFYSKSDRYYFKPLQEKSYNRGYKPYRFKGVEEFQDERGWYTMVNMKDVWQIDMVGRTSGERTGYATQKPEQLLTRIVESCSREGDLCADFFGGSATLASAAEEAGRRWISCDGGSRAMVTGIKRMAKKRSSFSFLCGTSEFKEDALQIDFSVDRERIMITLESYKLKAKDIPLKGEEKALVRKIARKDPLCFLEYWSVDFQYDGKSYCPRFFSEEVGDAAEWPLQELGEKICIRSADIFGNQIETIIEREVVLG